MTFCQRAGKHAAVAAGSTVAATEIDSNKCRERKRRGRGRGEGEEEGPKGAVERITGGRRMSGGQPSLDLDHRRR